MNLHKNLSFIKTYYKIPMAFGDYANYFLLSLFFGAFIYGGVLFLYQHFAVLEDPTALVMGPLFIIAGIIFIRFSFKRLRQNNKFEKIQLSSNETLESIAEKLKQHLRIKKIDLDSESGLIEIKTNTTLFSWGEIIILIWMVARFL